MTTAASLRTAGDTKPTVAFVFPGYAPHAVGGIRIAYEYGNRLAAAGYRVRMHYLVPGTGAATRSMALRKLAAPITMRKLDAHRREHGPGGGWFALSPDIEEVLTPWWGASRALKQSELVVATGWTTAGMVADATKGPGRTGLYLIQHYETWDGGEANTANVDATWQLPLHKIVIARWLRDHAASLGEAERTTYIPNGIDFEQLECRVPIAERNPNSVSMLVSGVAWKGHEYGLEALQIARRSNPDLDVTLFGSFDADALPSDLRYVGMLPSDKLVDLFNTHAIYMHTSLAEGWPLPPAESMSCGSALIAADNPGVLDYIEDGKSALVVPREDPQALADALLRLTGDSALRQRIAQTGREEIHKYTWDRAYGAFEATLREQWARA